MYEIYSEWTISQNKVIDVVRVSLLSILNRFYALFSYLHCWHCTSKCRLLWVCKMIGIAHISCNCQNSITGYKKTNHLHKWYWCYYFSNHGIFFFLLLSYLVQTRSSLVCLVQYFSSYTSFNLRWIFENWQITDFYIVKIEYYR